MYNIIFYNSFIVLKLFKGYFVSKYDTLSKCFTISKKLIISDPTWDLELKYFNNLIKKKVKNNLKRDLFIKKFLNKL